MPEILNNENENMDDDEDEDELDEIYEDIQDVKGLPYFYNY